MDISYPRWAASLKIWPRWVEASESRFYKADARSQAFGEPSRSLEPDNPRQGL